MRRTDGSDGGSAFPELLKVGEVAKSEGGITVRDYFAAKVLPEVRLANTFFSSGSSGSDRWNEDRLKWLQKVCDEAYEVADAMLLARDK